MDFGIFDLLRLFGSLGIFLYGMKLMSESLQKVAGDKMRNILSAMTSNRFLGVLTGVLITAVIQSSSATTVMVVSFVNAGLLSLVQSVGVIMGANVGTTFTAWLISILGFKVKISAFALPLIGVCFPLLFSKNNLRKSWGELVIGFALVFLGLDFLKDAVPDIKNNPEILAFLQTYADNGYWSTLLFMAIGTLLTIVIQSSSATMALTLVMCNNGWISFDIAAAMVLGENIGTTITANLAAMIGNVSAKRAARIHLLFNIIGVIWVLAIFPFFLKGIDKIMVSTSGHSPFTHVGSIPIALSIFHSVFNIMNVLLLVGLAPIFVKIATRMVKDTGEEEEFKLQHINIGTVSTSELGIIQGKKEIELYGTRVNKMFKKVETMFDEPKSKKTDKLWGKIEKYEQAHDAIELDIAQYLGQLSEGELSDLGARRVHAMYKAISEIESISDSCLNVAKTLLRKRENKLTFSEEMQSNIHHMFGLLQEAFDVMHSNLEQGYERANLEKALAAEAAINNFRDKLKKEHLKALEKKSYHTLTGVIYNDIFSECEKLGDYIINVTEAIVEIDTK
jgi:phosphate:Na+ symporter